MVAIISSTFLCLFLCLCLFLDLDLSLSPTSLSPTSLSPTSLSLSPTSLSPTSLSLFPCPPLCPSLYPSLYLPHVSWPLSLLYLYTRRFAVHVVLFILFIYSQTHTAFINAQSQKYTSIPRQMNSPGKLSLTSSITHTCCV